MELQVYRDVGQGRDERLCGVRGAAGHGDQPDPVPPAHGGHGEDQKTLLLALAESARKAGPDASIGETRI